MMTRTAATRMVNVGCPLCAAGDGGVVMRFDEIGLRERSRVHWRILRCRGCSLVRVDPRPVLESTRHVYEGDTYGFVRSSRTDAFVDGVPHATRILRELANIVRPGRLLEVGSATGEFLAAAWECGWQTHGVELSPHAAAVARRRGLDVTVGTLGDAQLPAASFDVVTMLDVIEHLVDPLAELREVYRVLRPGGLLCVETPNWKSVYRHLLGQRWAALQPRLHLLYLDARTASRLLDLAGFEVIRSTTEIVALFSPEGAARGVGPALIRSLLRDAMVRILLRLKPGPLDRFFLRIGPAARGTAGTRSFRQLATAGTSAPDDGVERKTAKTVAVLRTLNRPIDRLFLKLGMGEQLRVYGRKN